MRERDDGTRGTAGHGRGHGAVVCHPEHREGSPPESLPLDQMVPHRRPIADSPSSNYVERAYTRIIKQGTSTCSIYIPYPQNPNPTSTMASSRNFGASSRGSAISSRTPRTSRRWFTTGFRISAGWDSCLLYTSPSPRDGLLCRMPSSA